MGIEGSPEGEGIPPQVNHNRLLSAEEISKWVEGTRILAEYVAFDSVSDINPVIRPISAKLPLEARRGLAEALAGSINVDVRFDLACLATEMLRDGDDFAYEILDQLKDDPDDDVLDEVMSAIREDREGRVGRLLDNDEEDDDLELEEEREQFLDLDEELDEEAQHAAETTHEEFHYPRPVRSKPVTETDKIAKLSDIVFRRQPERAYEEELDGDDEEEDISSIDPEARRELIRRHPAGTHIDETGGNGNPSLPKGKT